MTPKDGAADADAAGMTALHRRILAAVMAGSLILVGIVGFALLGDSDNGTQEAQTAAGSDGESEGSDSDSDDDTDAESAVSDSDDADPETDAEVAGAEQSRDEAPDHSSDSSTPTTASTEAAATTASPTSAAPTTDGSATENEPETETESDPVAEADDVDTTEAEAESEPDAEPAEPKGSVTIAFGGDMHFERDLGVRLANETTTMLSPVADMLADADLAIANLETTVTERGEPTPGKAYNFRTTPQVFDALKTSGIDVVSVANNHGMDFGLVGLQDTLDAAEAADYPIIGAGSNADEAFAPYVANINGQRIAVIGATQVLDNSVRTLWTATDDKAGLASAKEVDVIIDAVAKARAEHDTVVVYLHWGIEGETCPAPRQLELSDQLIAAGADIIVGGHAHRLQSGGLKDGAFVHYGMGNFVFYKYSGDSTESGVLKVTVNGRDIEGYEWIPARLSNGVATAVDDQAELDKWNSRRSCTDLTE